MLEPQKTELPHETEYFLDGACENLDMDHGARMVLIVFGDRKRIDDILEGREKWDGWAQEDGAYDRVETSARFARFKAKRLAKCDQLTAYADELLAQLGPVHQVGAQTTAVQGLLTRLRANADHYSDCAMTNSLEGGNLANFSDRKYSFYEHERRDRRPTKRLKRILYSPAFVKRYVAMREESGYMRRLWHTLARRGAPACTKNEIEAALTVFDAAYEQHRARVDAAQRRALEAFSAEIRAAKDPAKRRAPYRIVKQERMVAKRAALFAAGLLGASTVSAFAAGHPVHIEGERMVFEAQRRGTIHRSGHAALHLSVLDKSRTKLAELCFFIDGTPAIDQLAGIALAVKAGEEQDILSTANITKVAPAGVGHELLGARAKPNDEAPIRAMWDNGVIVPAGDRNAVRRARNQTYWRETKDLWIDTLGVYVFNREWKRVKGMLK